MKIFFRTFHFVISFAFIPLMSMENSVEIKSKVLPLQLLMLKKMALHMVQNVPHKHLIDKAFDDGSYKNHTSTWDCGNSACYFHKKDSIPEPDLDMLRVLTMFMIPRYVPELDKVDEKSVQKALRKYPYCNIEFKKKICDKKWKLSDLFENNFECKSIEADIWSGCKTHQHFQYLLTKNTKAIDYRTPEKTKKMLEIVVARAEALRCIISNLWNDVEKRRKKLKNALAARNPYKIRALGFMGINSSHFVSNKGNFAKVIIKHPELYFELRQFITLGDADYYLLTCNTATNQLRIDTPDKINIKSLLQAINETPKDTFDEEKAYKFFNQWLPKDTLVDPSHSWVAESILYDYDWKFIYNKFSAEKYITMLIACDRLANWYCDIKRKFFYWPSFPADSAELFKDRLLEIFKTDANVAHQRRARVLYSQLYYHFYDKHEGNWPHPGKWLFAEISGMFAKIGKTLWRLR